MENQTIIITLEEYKQLRDLCEEYRELLGDYNFLLYLYQQLQPKIAVQKTKKIGFGERDEEDE